MSGSREAMDAYYKQLREACEQAADEEQTDAPVLQGHLPGTWPKKSFALGVHPDQIPAAIEDAKKHGVSIDFTPDGDAVVGSYRHRKAYAKMHGLRDHHDFS